VLLCTLAGAGAGARAARAASWSVARYPGNDGSPLRLSDVSCAARTDCEADGSRDVPGARSLAVAERWNGPHRRGRGSPRLGVPRPPGWAACHALPGASAGRPSGESPSGRHSADSTQRSAAETDTPSGQPTADSARATSGRGWRNARVVRPPLTSSPSLMRRRPRSRSPTNVRFATARSSTTVQSSPTRSSAACSLETWLSQPMHTSLPCRRPIVIRASSGATMDHLPPIAIAQEHMGMPRRSSSSRSMISARADRCGATGDYEASGVIR
jgi:hypothetical protein